MDEKWTERETYTMASFSILAVTHLRTCWLVRIIDLFSQHLLSNVVPQVKIVELDLVIEVAKISNLFFQYETLKNVRIISNNLWIYWNFTCYWKLRTAK
jgi:hypothetical protein